MWNKSFEKHFYLLYHGNYGQMQATTHLEDFNIHDIVGFFITGNFYKENDNLQFGAIVNIFKKILLKTVLVGSQILRIGDS